MKKKLLLLVLTLMLSVTTVCFASDGKDIDAQQKIVDVFLTSKSYATVKSYMAPEMVKNFSEKQYTDMLSSMNDSLGKLVDKDMVVYQKIKDGAILRYVAKYEKSNNMELIAAFKNDNGKFLLMDFFAGEVKVDNSAAKPQAGK